MNNIEKKNILSENFDRKKLLDELAIDIANKFWIEKEQAERLIKSETLVSLETLKIELNTVENKENILDNKKIKQLFSTIKLAKNRIEKASSWELDLLKKELVKGENIEEFKNNIEDYLPPKLISKAINPKTPHEHVLGFTLGTTNSVIATADTFYQIWKWILKTPYHLYMIITWKATTDSFKKV